MRLPRLVFAALAALSLSSVVSAEDITFKGTTMTFDNCFDFNDNTGIRLCSKSNADATPATITLAVQRTAPAAGGWVGFGFSNGGNFPMVGSTAVIGRMSADGSTKVVDNYDLNAKDSGSIVPSTRLGLISKDVDFDTATNKMTMVFTRPLQAAASFANIQLGQSSNCIWAVGDSVTSLQQHTDRNFGSVNFATGSVSSNDRIPYYRKVHAALMGLAFLFLLPVGIMLARFFRNHPPFWYYGHIFCQVAALALATAGFAIGINTIGTEQYKTHRVLGIIAMAFLFLQVLNTPFKPRLPAVGETMSMRRRVWNVIHHNTGRVAWILGVINVWIGMIDVYYVDRPTKIGVAVAFAVLMAFGVLLEIRRLCVGPKHADARPGVPQKGVPASHGMTAGPADSASPGYNQVV